MSEISHREQIVPCAEIPPVHMSGERRTLDKHPERSAFAVFKSWANHEARRLCERGSCVTGTCRGLVDIGDWRLVSEDDAQFTCEFSAEFSCRCR